MFPPIVGTNALAAINVVYPLVNILYGIALAFATGGSALAALHIGGKKNDEASRTFSISMTAAIVIGALVSALILFRLPVILQMLGATSLLMADCKAYIYWCCSVLRSWLEKRCSLISSVLTVLRRTVF